MRTLTYTITKGDFSVTTTNLEQAKQYSNQLGVPYEIALVTPTKRELRQLEPRLRLRLKKMGNESSPTFFNLGIDKYLIVW